MAFAMAFTMMAGAAYTDQDDIQATDAVELLATLNVMTGKGDGMFHPNDTITRAEICRIIYTIRNEGNDNANAYADMQTSFQDLTSADDWAKGYIKHCQSVNLISGRDAAGTIFGPQDPVTGVELAVICLRVLGYDPAKAGIGGESWSTKTIGLASEAGLLKGVNMESVTGPCERQWAAQIMANMLDAYTVRWSTDGDRYTTYAEDGNPNKKVGREYMKLHTTVGTLTSISGSNLDVVCNTSDIADSDGALETSFTNVNTDYTELLGQKVKVLYSDGKANSVIGVYALDGNTVYTVNANAVESDGDNKVKFDGKSYTIEYINTTNTRNNNNVLTTSTARDNGIIRTLFLNIDGGGTSNKDGNNSFTAQTGRYYEPTVTASWGNKYFNAEDVFDDWDGSSAIMKFVDSDNNGRLDSVIITDYAAAEVTSATSTKIVAGKSYNFSDENIDEDIKQGDWVSISWNRFDDCRDIKKLEVTTGKLDGLKKESESKNYDKDPAKSKGYQFNEYRVDNAWFNDAKNSNTDIKSVKAGDSIEYILLNGVAWKVQRAGVGSLDNVVDVAMVVNKDGTGLSGKQVKLQFFNDTTAVVDVDTYAKTTERVPYEELVNGTLYEYSVSGGKYIFETLNPTKDFYGDYTYAGTKPYTFGGDDGKSINQKAIDDVAKVILFKGEREKDSTGNESDVITGKQLKNLTSTAVGVSKDTAAEYFTADVSGLNRAAALAVKVDKFPENIVTNDYYGYILSDAILSQGNNEISYDLLLESGETVTVSEKSTKVADRKANTLIGYKSLTAEDSNGNRYIDDVTLYTLGKGENNNFGIGAVTSVNTNQSAVEIYGYGYSKTTDKFAWNHVNRDITSSTIIFYVDTDAKTGSTTGTINTAIEWGATQDAKESDFVQVPVDGEKAKVANCLYLDKDGSDLEVLVVDTADRQFRGPEVKNYNDENNSTVPSAKISDKQVARGELPTVTLAVTTKNMKAGSATVSATPEVKGITVDTPITIADNGTATITLSVNSLLEAGNFPFTFTIKDSEKNEVTATATLIIVEDTDTADSTDVSFSSVSRELAALESAMPMNPDNTVATLKDAVSDLVAAWNNTKVALTATATVSSNVVDNLASNAPITAGDTITLTMTFTAQDNVVFDAALEADADAPAIAGATAKLNRKSNKEIVVTYTYTAVKGAAQAAQEAVDAVKNTVKTNSSDLPQFDAGDKVAAVTLTSKGTTISATGSVTKGTSADNWESTDWGYPADAGNLETHFLVAFGLPKPKNATNACVASIASAAKDGS